MYMYGRIYDPRMGPHYPRLTLALFSSPGNQQSVGGVRVSTPCAAVSTRGITVFVRELSEL